LRNIDKETRIVIYDQNLRFAHRESLPRPFFHAALARQRPMKILTPPPTLRTSLIHDVNRGTNHNNTVTSSGRSEFGSIEARLYLKCASIFNHVNMDIKSGSPKNVIFITPPATTFRGNSLHVSQYHAGIAVRRTFGRVLKFQCTNGMNCSAQTNAFGTSHAGI